MELFNSLKPACFPAFPILINCSMTYLIVLNQKPTKYLLNHLLSTPQLPCLFSTNTNNSLVKILLIILYPIKLFTFYQK